MTAFDPLAVVLGLLYADAPATVIAAPEDWPRWAVLLPHVLAAAECFERERDVGDDQSLAGGCSWLLDRAGTYLQVHARFSEARRLIERALSIDETVHGPDHPDVATDLSNLATVLRDLGQPG